MRIKSLSDNELLEAAEKARGHSNAKFSGYRVGAALLTKDGTVYTGCNLENYSLSLSICAERVALYKALSEGAREFVKIAVVTDGLAACPPCGACRQALYEFAPDIDVVMAENGDNIKIINIKELLPYPFKK